MSHQKQDQDTERGTMFSNMDIPQRTPPPTSGRAWCADRTYYHLGEMPKRRKVRCPSCNRIVLPRESHCVGGELLGFIVPMHKKRPKTKKRPSRSAGHARRERGKR